MRMDGDWLVHLLSSSRVPYHAQYRQRYTTPRRFDDGFSSALSSSLLEYERYKASMAFCPVLFCLAHESWQEILLSFFTLGFDSLIFSQVTYSSSAGSSE